MYDEDNPDQISRCRELNDQLRISMGQNDTKNIINLTAGLRAMGDEFVSAAMMAIREYDGFNSNNDPYGEHDIVFVVVHGQKVMGKIDYYDNELKLHSPDKADPAVTKRVLSIMLGSEY